MECLPFCFFFQNTSFSTTYHVFENWPFHLHQICLNTLWSVIKLLWTSAKLGITGKNVKLFYFTGKVTFFRKLLFSTFTELSQKRSCNLHNNCLNLLWVNGIASWCGHTQKYEKKTGQNHREGSIFSENSPSAS